MASLCYTLAHSLTLQGIGLHSGEHTAVHLRPLPEPSIALTVNGSALRVAATHVTPTPLRTTLTDGAISLATPEHLFAALYGLGVFGVAIEIDGYPEVPILDGSALPWVHAIDAAGRTPLATPPAPLVVSQAVQYADDDRLLVATPRPEEGLEVACDVTFSTPTIGRQQWRGVITEATFRHALAPARSFALQADVEAAMAAGLLKGASLASGVLMTRENKIANPEGLRFPDEPVRHKVLDFLGDAYLAGQPLEGNFNLTAPGHTANNALLQRVLNQSKATP